MHIKCVGYPEREVVLMNKKIIKRSLALGMLMGFVITGNVCAEEITNTYNVYEWNTPAFDTTRMFDISGDAYIAYMKPVDKITPNKLVIETSIIRNETQFMLYAGINSTVNKFGPVNTVTSGNLLDVNSNVGTKKYLELYGGAVHAPYTLKLESNGIEIIGESDDELITISADDWVGITGGLVNTGTFNVVAKGNFVVLENMKFDTAYVYIEGAEARDASVESNIVSIKNTNINNVDVYGGNAQNRKGQNLDNYADYNIVTIGDGTRINGNIYGGYVTDGSSKSHADYNVVNFNGNGTMVGFVYGGYSSNGSANNNTINVKDTASLSSASLYGSNKRDSTGNTLNIGWVDDEEKYSSWSGKIGSVQNFDTINIHQGSEVEFINALNTFSTNKLNINSGTWKNTDASIVKEVNLDDGVIRQVSNEAIIINKYSGNGSIDYGSASSGDVLIDSGNGTLNLNMMGATDLEVVANKIGVKEEYAKENIKATIYEAAGTVKGESITEIDYKKIADNAGYYHGTLGKVTEKVNPINAAIDDIMNVGLMAWRAENNDMYQRLGDLRNSNGDLGVWVRVVNGENEYKVVENEYKTYQLGYDEKLSVDQSWIVGVAVSYTEGESVADKASGENVHKGLSVYGSKINNDGSFVDLIAKIAHIEHDFTVAEGKGEWSSNGYSFSTEYGKRIKQGNGLWIEPQLELTYGKIGGADCELAGRTVTLENMESLVGRLGVSIGKNIKQGNVYARASYLYDFDGKTITSFSDGRDTRSFGQDLGGGWWEVGVGANINMSKATYIYADVEKTFGGEVDTNWQWNLGVRYSF